MRLFGVCRSWLKAPRCLQLDWLQDPRASFLGTRSDRVTSSQHWGVEITPGNVPAVSWVHPIPREWISHGEGWQEVPPCSPGRFSPEWDHFFPNHRRRNEAEPLLFLIFTALLLSWKLKVPSLGCILPSYRSGKMHGICHHWSKQLFKESRPMTNLSCWNAALLFPMFFLILHQALSRSIFGIQM